MTARAAAGRSAARDARENAPRAAGCLRAARRARAARAAPRSGGSRGPRGIRPRPRGVEATVASREMMRTLTGCSTFEPTGRTTRSSTARSSLTCSGERHVADLVEEQGAAEGGFEQPAPVLHRAGEGAALVAEQLAFQQALGDRGAVERDERSAGARTGAVDRRAPAVPCRCRSRRRCTRSRPSRPRAARARARPPSTARG